MSGLTSRALPVNTWMSVQVTKPAPMPFVIEYVNGMIVSVRNAGMPI